MREPDVKILVVEDDPLVRQVVARCLRDGGFDVTEARSVSGAFAASDRERPSLVVCDAKLGGEEGVDLVQDLIARRPGLRALVMSGYPQHMIDPELSLPWLRKPFGVDELVARVREVLRAPAPRAGRVRIRTQP